MCVLGERRLGDKGRCRKDRISPEGDDLYRQNKVFKKFKVKTLLKGRNQWERKLSALNPEEDTAF